MKLFFTFLSVVLLLGPSHRASAQGPGTQVARSTPLINGGTCYFLQFTPWDSTIHAATKHPLIIFLHGAGEKGDGGFSTVGNVAANGVPHLCSSAVNATMGFTVNGVYSTFYVLSPQLTASQGNWTSNYVQTMINYAKANLNIDSNRIYLTGLSVGGGGCWRFVLDSSTAQANQIAAMASMSPTDEANDNNICTVLYNSHLPIWNFTDDNDPNYPYTSAGTVNHIRLTFNIYCPSYTPAPRWTWYSDNTHNHAWEWGSDTGHASRTLSSNTEFPSTVGSGTIIQNPNVYEWFLSNTRATNSPQPPAAHTGPLQIINLPTSQATLTGSGTAVSPATISSYSWTFLSGPATPSIASPTSASTLVTGLSSTGLYQFRLTVTDNNGLTGSAVDSVQVTDLRPIVNAGDDKSITLPVSSVSLAGTATAQGGNTITSTTWTKISGPPGSTITSPSSLNTTVTGLTQGTYVFQLKAVDNQGLADSSQVTVYVNAAPSPSGALAYIVQVPGPIGNCGDTSSSGRIPVYGDSLSNGGILYTDSAKTTIYNGGFNWFESAATTQGPIQHDLVVYPDGSIHNLNSCPGVTSSSPTGVTVLGYIKVSYGPDGYCGDTAVAGRTAIYADSLGESVILSPDPQRQHPLDGGFNWYSFSTTLTGAITRTFSVYPDGSMHSLRICPGSSQSNQAIVSRSNNSLDDTGGSTKLSLYPNPVKDMLILHISGKATGKVMTRISSLTGVILRSQAGYKEAASLDLPLSLGNLPAGMYLVEVWIGTTVEFRQKVLKL